MSESQDYTVTEVNTLVKEALGSLFEDSITVIGEASNVKISNGNLFLTLKDANSCISVISWSYTKLKYKEKPVEIKDGDKLVVTGKITTYIKNSNYSLIASKIELAEGEQKGELHLQYEKIRKEYEEKGYFDDTMKMKFPSSINKLGIVSSNGAAIEDVMYVLKKNNFKGKIIFKSCTVQGTTCPDSVVAGVKILQNWKDEDGSRLDLILITRGGGSFEDLMGFSHRKVLNCIIDCDIFTISAIGHEIDFMLSDFAADMRCPTPSIAAEHISGHQKTQLDILEKYDLHFKSMTSHYLINSIQNLKHKNEILLSKLTDPNKTIDEAINNLDSTKKAICNAMTKYISLYKLQLSSLNTELSKFDVSKIMEQGYSIVLKNNIPVNSAQKLKSGQKLKIKMHDGDVEVTVV
jgi:exodeoxyribonuclease VII large subunit